MKRIRIILLIIIICMNVTCISNNVLNDTKSLSEQLAKIEKNQDLKSLKTILDDKILVYIPDAPIIYSKEVVVELFKYSWSRNEVNTDILYKANSIKEHKNEVIEGGIYSYKDDKGDKIEMPYRIVGIKVNNKFLIKELVYANSKKQLPVLPKPTGVYKVGQSTHFYQKDENRKRPIAFQIWYPTNNDSEKKLPFQSKTVARGICEFLGWPIFNNSFTVLMKSNSISNPHIVQNKKFPVVIYNHGYGGASPVYQTVFEELASHGYIVVSLGHQDESAFLIKENGSIVQNSPQNEFYQKRAPELNNRTIGQEQSIILNSDNLEDLTKAYKKLVNLSPLHTESVNLWTSDTENTIKILQDLNNHNTNLKGSFDFNNMGIFGHSVGGATAGQLASETIFKAGINIDGFQFGNLINSKLRIPFLFISSNQEGNRYLRVTPFADSTENDTYQAIIKGFSHDSFSDLQLFSPNGDNDIQLQRELILGFFNKYLKNRNIDFKSIKSQYKNLRINKLK